MLRNFLLKNGVYLQDWNHNNKVRYLKMHLHQQESQVEK
jgi:hypothetical protein